MNETRTSCYLDSMRYSELNHVCWRASTTDAAPLTWPLISQALTWIQITANFVKQVPNDGNLY